MDKERWFDLLLVFGQANIHMHEIPPRPSAAARGASGTKSLMRRPVTHTIIKTRTNTENQIRFLDHAVGSWIAMHPDSIECQWISFVETSQQRVECSRDGNLERLRERF